MFMDGRCPCCVCHSQWMVSRIWIDKLFAKGFFKFKGRLQFSYILVCLLEREVRGVKSNGTDCLPVTPSPMP